LSKLVKVPDNGKDTSSLRNMSFSRKLWGPRGGIHKTSYDNPYNHLKGRGPLGWFRHLIKDWFWPLIWFQASEIGDLPDLSSWKIAYLNWIGDQFENYKPCNCKHKHRPHLFNLIFNSIIQEFAIWLKSKMKLGFLSIYVCLNFIINFHFWGYNFYTDIKFAKYISEV
jgi:hypothetical protein